MFILLKRKEKEMTEEKKIIAEKTQKNDPFQAHVKEEFKKKRPSLSAGSLKTYASVIANLLKRCEHAGDLSYLTSHSKEVIQVLSSETYAGKANTVVAALVVLTGVTDYQSILVDIAKTNKIKKEQGIMTPKEVKNNLPHEELVQKFNELEKSAAVWLKIQKMDASHSETEINCFLQKYQQYIILVLTSGLFFPPRRSQDWCDMYFRGEQMKINETNHMLKDKFVFNVFKTGAHYGTQEIPIPPQVKTILSRWIKLIPDGVNTLLFSDNRKPLTSSSLAKRLNFIFGRKVSTTALRHTFLTKTFGKEIEEMKAKEAHQDKVMKEMGSSVLSLPFYVKK